jgi:hypothetical protein
LRTQQHWEVVFWVALLVWAVVWGLFGCGCGCEGGFFNMAVDGLGEFAMLESCGRIFMLWGLLQDMVLAPVSTVEKLKIRVQIVLHFQKEIGMVRSPRFEPGSSAWQADVLDQTRLRPHIHGFLWSSDQCRWLYRLLGRMPEFKIKSAIILLFGLLVMPYYSCCC